MSSSNVYLASAKHGASLEEIGQNGERETTFPMMIKVGDTKFSLSHQNLVRQVACRQIHPDSRFTETLEQVQKIIHTIMWCRLVLDPNRLLSDSLFIVVLCRCRWLIIQEWKAAFGLTKGEKESCFWFVKKGNLGRKACVWLILIEKSWEG